MAGEVKCPNARGKEVVDVMLYKYMTDRLWVALPRATLHALPFYYSERPLNMT